MPQAASKRLPHRALIKNSIVRAFNTGCLVSAPDSPLHSVCRERLAAVRTTNLAKTDGD